MIALNFKCETASNKLFDKKFYFEIKLIAKYLSHNSTLYVFIRNKTHIVKYSYILRYKVQNYTIPSAN